MPKKCENCGREIVELTMNLIVTLAKKTEEEYKNEVEKVTGTKMKDPEGFVCPNCGMIYNINKIFTGVPLEPVEEVRKYYGYSDKN